MFILYYQCCLLVHTGQGRCLGGIGTLSVIIHSMWHYYGDVDLHPMTLYRFSIFTLPCTVGAVHICSHCASIPFTFRSTPYYSGLRTVGCIPIGRWRNIEKLLISHICRVNHSLLLSHSQLNCHNCLFVSICLFVCICQFVHVWVSVFMCMFGCVHLVFPCLNLFCSVDIKSKTQLKSFVVELVHD